MENILIYSSLSPLNPQSLIPHISGYSQKQISNILGLPISTINSRLHSALSRLKTKQSTFPASIQKL
ncbi:sigma factor-like helix-turn-helix DNA-binding protein [Fischerella thermalis]|uniref:sigma factor-like helix-turn-helix DNA-binding protein n=1 Tax=Fischerella thermalis TaxID=372787 RepID=UPI003B528907